MIFSIVSHSPRGLIASESPLAAHLREGRLEDAARALADAHRPDDLAALEAWVAEAPHDRLGPMVSALRGLPAPCTKPDVWAVLARAAIPSDAGAEVRVPADASPLAEAVDLLADAISEAGITSARVWRTAMRAGHATGCPPSFSHVVAAAPPEAWSDSLSADLMVSLLQPCTPAVALEMHRSLLGAGLGPEALSAVLPVAIEACAQEDVPGTDELLAQVLAAVSELPLEDGKEMTRQVLCRIWPDRCTEILLQQAAGDRAPVLAGPQAAWLAHCLLTLLPSASTQPHTAPDLCNFPIEHLGALLELACAQPPAAGLQTSGWDGDVTQGVPDPNVPAAHLCKILKALRAAETIEAFQIEPSAAVCREIRRTACRIVERWEPCIVKWMLDADPVHPATAQLDLEVRYLLLTAEGEVFDRADFRGILQAVYAQGKPSFGSVPGIVSLREDVGRQIAGQGLPSWPEVLWNPTPEQACDPAFSKVVAGPGGQPLRLQTLPRETLQALATAAMGTGAGNDVDFRVFLERLGSPAWWPVAAMAEDGQLLALAWVAVCAGPDGGASLVVDELHLADTLGDDEAKAWVGNQLLAHIREQAAGTAGIEDVRLARQGAGGQGSGCFVLTAERLTASSTQNIGQPDTGYVLLRDEAVPAAWFEPRFHRAAAFSDSGNPFRMAEFDFSDLNGSDSDSDGHSTDEQSAEEVAGEEGREEPN